MAKLPEDHGIDSHKDEVGQIMHRWKHHDPKPLHSGRGKGGKEGKIVKSQDQAIAIALSMSGKSKKGQTSNHAERFVSMGFSEGVAQTVADMLDFSRCERPDGSHYGTGGKCRKGKEVGPDEVAAISQLAKMLPKGEKIVDSSGKVHTSESIRQKSQAERDEAIDRQIKKVRRAKAAGDPDWRRLRDILDKMLDEDEKKGEGS